MIIEQALRTELATNAGVIALVGQRIYYVGYAIQDVTKPYIVIQTIDDIPTHAHDGFCKLSTARIQINTFDDSYLGCKAVDAAVFTAIDSFHGTMGGAGGVTIGRCLKDMSGDFPNDDNPNISGIHTDYMITYST
jgi:hypothetical protein